MSDEKEGFDLDKMAAEIAEQEPVDQEPEIQEEEVAESSTADETTEQPEAKVEESATGADEDDHEKYAASLGGKPISQKAFLERLGKEKAKRLEAENRYKEDKAKWEAAQKAQPATQADLEQFERLKGVFQNFDKSAREMPWVTDMLLALGQGKKPDWEKVKKGMEDYMASVPKGDPILYQQQQEMRAQLEEIQNERIYTQAAAHISQEDVEITKILGDKTDPVAATWWAILNEQAKHAFEAMNPKSFKEGPDRVAMAKRLVAAAQAYHQKQLKAALPSPTKAKANLNAGSGTSTGPSASKKPPTDIHSKDFAAWVLGS